jgi:prepilin-type N-terminal cleavage/methylation domain-containing protein
MTAPRPMQRVCHRIRCATSETAESGFTLIEVIVSFVIFAVVAGAATAAIIEALHASHQTQQRVTAAGVAQSFVAQAIANANKIAPEQGKIVTPSVGGNGASEEQFTVVRTITFINPPQSDTCAPGHLYNVNVIVKQAQSGQFLARSDAVIACPPA